MQTNPESAAVEAVAWPDYLMIRDTGLHDDMGGLGQRIYTTAGAGYKKEKYVRASSLDALRGEVADRDAVIECKNIDIRERDRSLHEWAERAKAAERRAAELEAALRDVLSEHANDNHRPHAFYIAANAIAKESP